MTDAQRHFNTQNNTERESWVILGALCAMHMISWFYVQEGLAYSAYQREVKEGVQLEWKPKDGITGA